MSVQDLLDLRGRTALVVGGAGHLGRVAADTLAELGAAICLVDLHPDVLRAAGDDIVERHRTQVLPIAVDITDDDALAEVPTTVVDRFGSLDIVIHSAALVGTSTAAGWAVPFAEQSAAAWRKAVDVNLTSAFVLCQAAAPHLSRSEAGSVVLVSSIHGVVAPDPAMYDGTTMVSPAAYAASKGGMIQLGRWLASYMSPAVRVNCVSPGGIERGQPEVFQARYSDRTPLGRMGTEDDLRGAFAFLCSDLSRYVTGQNLIVDGGLTIR